MTSPLDAPSESYVERLFLRGLRRARLDRLALRALFKAQHLLGLTLAQRLIEMRHSSDRAQAVLAQAESRALLAHVLRQAVELLGERIDKLPERRRPHYTPAQRFRILEIKNLAALTQHGTARLFRVSTATIARWAAQANPDSCSVGSTVTPVPPVRRYNDTVHHVVRTLAGLGFGGYGALARHLARAGWKIGNTTVARYLREPRRPGPTGLTQRPTETTKRAVRARFVHHIWHLDLTEIQGFFRSVSFSLALLFDNASRMPLAWKVFDRRHTAADMTAFVDAAMATHGKPRHLVVDRDGAFTADAFRERVAAWRVSLRFCSADNHRANARIERFWLTLKHGLLRLRPPAATLAVEDLERDLDRALRYYAFHRPHQGLGGATPAEVYFGLEPAYVQAVQPPRGRRGDPAVPWPATTEYLDGDRRFPFLRTAA